MVLRVVRPHNALQAKEIEMRTEELTEAELHDFIERFDGFTAQLPPRARHFLTIILLRACTSQATKLVGGGLHPDSTLHAHLAYTVWELTRPAEWDLSVNPLPLPRT